ncbi:hypothetical protein [Paraburkholderia elongata]|uniref:Uncharacterized protein n=1 Tax=Paraburkholderia elongata TaxID=2675747 RepID=A0A972NTS0_9BURK|nr:hypothetical protein [Paraburkholderia elongata]NPT59696.1 hypothetical protein [Paraburkholderia elongata]
MSRSNGVLLFGAGTLAGIVVGWFIRFPPTDSASASGWAQALGSLAAIFIAVWVPLRERRATEARIAAEKFQRAHRLAERLRSITFDVILLVHNTLAKAESRWNRGEKALDIDQISELNQRLTAAQQDEYNKQRIVILDGLRALLKEFKVLCEVEHISDFALAPDFATRRNQWMGIVNSLNDESLRAVQAVENGASD